MRPIFTIHAAEYLLGSYIEHKFKNINVWVPSKDTGVDLLLTDKKNKKAVSVQVKFSKDYLEPRYFGSYSQEKLKACGWWSHDTLKIKKTPADFWIFVLYCQKKRNIQSIIINPKDLLKRLQKIHGNARKIQSYFQITMKNRCWETRDLKNKKEDESAIIEGEYSNKVRNFSEYLNNWDPIQKILKK